MKAVLTGLFIIFLTSCASNDLSQQNTSTETTPVNSQPMLFSQQFGMLTDQQIFQVNQRLKADNQSLSIWPVIEKHRSKLANVYEPNFIVGDVQIEKPLRLKYQKVIDEYLTQSGKTQLRDEYNAELYFFTLVSSIDNPDGSVTLEYVAAVSDLREAQSRISKSQSEIEALVQTTIWRGMVRDKLPAERIKTNGQVDQSKVAEEIIRMAGTAMEHFPTPDGSECVGPCGQNPSGLSQNEILQIDFELAMALQHAEATGDYSEYHNLIKAYAEVHHPDSENVLGLMYLSGTGVEQNTELGVTYFERAIAHGSVNAPFNLGVQYDMGKLLPQDKAKAITLYKKSAALNLNRAQYNVCNMLINGDGVEQDLAAAKPYCRAAAENGFVEAWTRYATLEALEGNWQLAFELASKGVKANDIGAARFIGKISQWLITQEALSKHEELVAVMKQSCELAARLGDQKSVTALIHLYQDTPEIAYFWHSVLAQQLGVASTAEMEQIKSTLSDEQIAEADENAKALIAEIPSASDHCLSCKSADFGQKG